MSGLRPLSPPPKAKATKPVLDVAEWQQVEGRDVAALMDPRPTLIVSSRASKKKTGFATIIWATPISHKPPMVAFSLRARSHTMMTIQESGVFSISVLPPTEEGIRICETLGTRTGHMGFKGPMVAHHLVPVEFDKATVTEVEVPRLGLFRRTKVEEVVETVHVVTEVPVIDCATSWITCSVDHIEETGDHLLVVGNVIEAQTCAPRNTETGNLEPISVLQCIQHGAYGKVARICQDK